jgi:hypothetical protein
MAHYNKSKKDIVLLKLRAFVRHLLSIKADSSSIVFMLRLGKISSST